MLRYSKYTDKPQIDTRIEESISYNISFCQFVVRHLSQKKTDIFWKTMTDWDWSHDNELFWLNSFDKNTGNVPPPPTLIYSRKLPNRIYLLFEVLSKLFPKLEASVEIEYGPSEMMWNMGISNYGGYLTITLMKGKVTCNDLPII